MKVGLRKQGTGTMHASTRASYWARRDNRLPSAAQVSARHQYNTCHTKEVCNGMCVLRTPPRSGAGVTGLRLTCRTYQAPTCVLHPVARQNCGVSKMFLRSATCQEMLGLTKMLEGLIPAGTRRLHDPKPLLIIGH